MRDKLFLLANAERLMFLGGLVAFLITIWFVRKRDIREKYALTWIAVSFLVLLGGLFPKTVMQLAQDLHLSHSAFVLYIALGFGYLYAFGLSISLSRQFHRNRRLTQEIALLEERVRSLETASVDANDSSSKPAV